MMTKPKTWADVAPSLDADWTLTISDLIAEARAVDWDFDNWCHVSGYDASDRHARRMFQCLLAYARRERGAGLN
jgi:hypothetical protein